ncbi:MAG: HAD-IB family hydrolase [Exilibacterium sp.]
MSLAIFDLDNTLLGGDSDHQWGEFLIEKQLVDSDEYRRQNDRFYRDYKNGSLNIHAFLSFALEPLSRFPIAELEILRQEFLQCKIAPLRLPKADALLQQHRSQGDDLLIITATNRFITGPIAEAMGVNDLLATEPEVVNGRYTGRVVDTPCFREGKVARLNTWLENYPGDLVGSYFYSDSANDIPLLDKVDYPIAVDPDQTLRIHAQANDWKIISLR